MHWLYRYSIRHPRLVLLIGILVPLAVSPGILKLRLRTDGHALVPPDAPEVALDRQIRDEFLTEDPIVVLIRSPGPDGIFNFQTLGLVQKLTYRFLELPGVRPEDLFSLETEHTDRVKTGTLTFRRFLEPLPTTQQELDTVRSDLRAIQLFNGTLVSDDEQATSILLGVPKGTNRSELFRTIHDIIDEQGDIPEQVEVIGAPVAEALLGTHILQDMGVPLWALGQRRSLVDDAETGRFPRSFFEFRLFIARHIGLVPISLLIMAIIFHVSFRSFAAVLLPLTEIGACLIFVFSLMGWFGVPIYLTIAVLPVILTVTGVTDEIHVFTEYLHRLRLEPQAPHADVLERTMRDMLAPVTKASLTTGIGFLSFSLSPIEPVWAFGTFTAIGMGFCMLWSLAVVPALLVMVDPRRWGVRRAHTMNAAAIPHVHALGPAVMARMARWVVRWRYAVLAAVVLFLVIAPSGLRRVVVQDSWIDGFSPQSDFHRSTEWFNQHFLGTHLLLLRVDAAADVPHIQLRGKVPAEAVTDHEVALPADVVGDPHTMVGAWLRLHRTGAPLPAPTSASTTIMPADWTAWIEGVRVDKGRLVVTTPRQIGSLRVGLGIFAPGQQPDIDYEIQIRQMAKPETIQRIRELEQFVRGRTTETVGGVIGTSDYLTTIRFMAMARRDGMRSIPVEPEKIDWLWSQYQRIRGEGRLRQLVDPGYNHSLVTVFLKDANFIAVGRLMDEIRAYEREQLAPHGIRLDFAGDVAVSQTLIQAIVSTQVGSLGVSLLGDLAITALLGRSIGWGIYCVLPCALAVIVNFAVMGWVGMPLGVATSMFAGMTLGVGVDYAIHLMERFRLAELRGLSRDDAIADAVSSTGPPLIIDGAAVSLGFGVMMLSQVPANARLGGLVILSVATSLTATMLLLPALLRIWRPKFRRAAVEGPSSRSDSPILKQSVHE